MPAWVTSSVHEKAIATLVQARKDAGLTQRDLAARTGKHQSFIAKVERCERNRKRRPDPTFTRVI